MASIVVVSAREGTFKVQCRSSGRALRMSVVGPDNYYADLRGSIEPVGSPQWRGNDTYKASTAVISGGRNGDVYQCTASNDVSSRIHSVELKGKTSFPAV